MSSQSFRWMRMRLETMPTSNIAGTCPRTNHRMARVLSASAESAVGHLRELVGLSKAATRPPSAAGLRIGGRHFPLTTQARSVFREGQPEASGQKLPSAVPRSRPLSRLQPNWAILTRLSGIRGVRHVHTFGPERLHAGRESS